MKALDLGRRGNVTLIGQPVDVGRDDASVDGVKIVTGSSADLHVAEQQLTEVEAEGKRFPEAEVDQHERIAMIAAEEVVGARIAVAGKVRSVSEFLDPGGHVVEGVEHLPIEHRLVRTEEEAERVSFRGSPTILIDGVDPFAEGDEPIGLSCRIYRTPDGYAGSPTLEQIAALLERE